MIETDNNMIIPKISRKHFAAKCVCQNSMNCAILSRSFQDLNDLRGSFVQYPMINGSQRFFLNKIKNKKAERFSFYLGIPNPFETSKKNGVLASMVDRRNRKRNTPKETYQKGVERKRLFVALHHFHPRMIDPKCGIARVECNGTRFKLPDLVSISTLESESLMEYYSPDDQHDQHLSLIVPNYLASKSEEDLFRIQSCITSLSLKNSAHSLNFSSPPSKRSRVDEVSIPNQITKRIKVYSIEGNAMDDRVELNDVQRNIAEVLGELYTKMHAMNTFRLIRSRQINNGSYKKAPPINLTTEDTLTIESISEIQLINSLQKQLSDMKAVDVCPTKMKHLLGIGHTNTFVS